jgi:hypothetical protein
VKRARMLVERSLMVGTADSGLVVAIEWPPSSGCS